LVRALNLWPIPNATVTLAGNYEPSFVLSQTGGVHYTFSNYFEREVLGCNQKIKVNLLKAHGPDALRELLWSADVFVYASVHEDENFGMVPREAALCGVPVVVSDFCGLGQLGRGVGGLLPTYPTLAGPRYSLQQLRALIEESFTVNKIKLQKNIRFVVDECSPLKAKADLKKSAVSLLEQKLSSVVPHRKAAKELLARLLQYADPGILQAVIEKNKPIPEGLLVDGTGFHNTEYAYHRLLSTIQGFYTTTDKPPCIKAGDHLRGFFRLALWQEEKALVELGFPGPRCKRYRNEDWRDLTAGANTDGNDMVFCPHNQNSVRLAQELVDLGYLVLDSLSRQGFI
jgi:hypothetical protein